MGAKIVPEIKKDAFFREPAEGEGVVNRGWALLWRGVLTSTHTQKILIIRGLGSDPP